jgi:hypothetical protein
MESAHEYEGPEDEESICFECRHCVTENDSIGKCCCPLPRWLILKPGEGEIHPSDKAGDCPLFEPTV